jgi:exonuclease III
MKIATWNLERPSISSKDNGQVLDTLRNIDADILILTETNSCIHPGEEYSDFSTADLFGSVSKKGEPYQQGERRVTVWSKYREEVLEQTSNSHSGVVVGLSTPFGKLNVYGTVIGVYGSRDSDFNPDLEAQIADWQKLSALGSLCVAGDFNISFADGYYYTKLGRQKIDDCFKELKIDLLTRAIPENIDHIAISDSFLKDVVCKTEEWNVDKRLSDHKGICLTLERS